MRRRITIGVVSISVLFAPAALAAKDLPEGAEARALYDDGMRLWDAGRFKPACDKLAESYRLEPASGTVFNLGVCYERTGRLASAYSCYARAEEEDRRRGNTSSAKEARALADDLLPRIPKVIISVPVFVKNTEGLVVRRNGNTVPEAQWGTPIFVDPGEVTVDVSARGRAPWKMVKKVEEGKTYEMAVAPLEELPMPAQKKVAIGLGGLALSGGVVGGIWGGIAFTRWNDVRAHCGPSIPVCGQGPFLSYGRELQSNASSAATVSTVAFSVGLAALGAAVYLWVSTPPHEEKANRAARPPAVWTF